MYPVLYDASLQTFGPYTATSSWQLVRNQNRFLRSHLVHLILVTNMYPEKIQSYALLLSGQVESANFP